jgi:Rrf2 family protein
MRLSKKGEYALRALIALARPRDKAMTISEVAIQQKLPKKFLEQILLALKAEGLVRSKAGPKGGYELAEPARSISVGRILTAVEEPIAHTGKRTGKPPAGVGAIFDDIRQYVRQKLDTVTLQDIADQAVTDEDVEALMWYI